MKRVWNKDVPIVLDRDCPLDAADVVSELQRAPFHPRIDYLDMFMQLGYVTQFTTAWALAPIPSMINNLLELRGDVLKMTTGFRRPIPVREK